MKIDMNKVSYVLGYSIGSDFKHKKFDINVDEFIDAFKSATGGEASKIQMEEMQQIMMAFQQAVQQEQQASKAQGGEAALEKGKAFLAENAKKEGIITTESGLQYRIIEEGTGKQPTLSDQITAHYEGQTIDGNVFDSSIKRGQPATFPVNGVIKGWQEALPMMKEGAKYELFIPQDLAYGPAGAGNAIGPNEALIFKVELIKVV